MEVKIILPNIGSIWLSDSSDRSSLILPPTQSTSHEWSVPGGVKVKFQSCGMTKVSRSKYLQEARRAFQYRANSNISAHALSWKRKEDATVPGKDKSAQRNSNVFIKRSQSKSEGKQSMGIYFHLCQMQMVLASSLFYIFIQSLYVFVLTCTQGVSKKCKNHTWYLSRTPQTASV